MTSSTHDPALNAKFYTNRWPGGSNLTTDKVPTEIAYGPDGKIRWGYEIRPDEDRLRCFKLRLAERRALPIGVSTSGQDELLARWGKDAQTATADYMGALWRHAKEVLRRRWPFMPTTTVEIILTVPAVWPDAAKNATLSAAKRAGMGDSISLISEPEAAAVYTLKSMQLSHLRSQADCTTTARGVC